MHKQGLKSLHQQHLTRTLNRLIQAALVMRGKTGVFTRQNASLIGHELAKQIRILEVEGVHREINLRLRARCAFFSRATATAAVGFVCVCLARHRIT